MSDLVIEFERSGGFAGQTLSTRVRSSDLPAGQAAELERLVTEARLRTPATHEPMGKPDRFHYRLRISGSTGADCDIGLAEESLSPAEARIVECLTGIAQQNREAGGTTPS